MRRRLAFALPGIAGVLMAGVTLLLGRLRPGGDGPGLFVLLAALVGLYLVALVISRSLVRAGSLPWLPILILGLLIRLPLIAAPPFLSDDIYRYVWDGRVAASGVNPFRYPPVAPELEPLRNPDWQKINNPGLPTIYPPAAQALFLVAARLGMGVPGFKLLFVAMDLATALLILRMTARSGGTWRFLLYWWHPLPIVEFAWSGHVDIAGILLLVAAAALALTPAPLLGRVRGVAIGALLGVAALIKFLALPAAPFVAGRRWIAALAGFLAVALLLYVPYLGAGIDPTGSLATYLARWRSNDFLFGFILRPGSAMDQELRLAQAKLLALGILAVAAGVVAALRLPLPRSALVVPGIALLLSPTIHPWYVTWLIPFLALDVSFAWFYLTLAVLLAYHPLPHFLAGGGWKESGAIKALEFGPFAVLALVEGALWLRKRRRPVAESAA